MLRVLGLLPYPTGRVAGQRFRIEQWAQRLQEHGVQLQFSSFMDDDEMRVVQGKGSTARKAAITVRRYRDRFRAVQGASDWDAVFLYREAAPIGGAWPERFLVRRCPTVFDFDDSIFMRPPVSLRSGWAVSLRPPHKTADICRMSAHVTVGNAFLASFALRHTSHVTIVPTTIDTDEYLPSPRRARARPVVGWSGQETTLCYLETILPALRRLRREADFELRVIGAEPDWKDIPVDSQPWRAATEVADLNQLDVGLMPLEEDDWCRGKCGLKALQYMALGIPPIVSPVGVNSEIVTDGVNGFIARTEEEWVDRVLLLLRDADLRARLGDAARQTVVSRYSCRAQAPRIAEVFKQVAGR